MVPTTGQIETLDDIGHSAIRQELVRDKNVFVLKVKDDSFMDEQIRDGDLILVEACSTAENGETVLALVNGEEMVKKFYIEDEGRVRLQPTDEKVKPIIVNRGEVEICGLVVAVIRKYSGGFL